MNRQYSPKTFLRQTPNGVIQRYCLANDIDLAVDWDTITPRGINVLFDAIEALPDEQRETIERDFRQVFDMSHACGRLLLVEQAGILGVDLAERIAEVDSHYEAAMIAFLEHGAVFEIASCVHDMYRVGHWRKRTVGKRLHASDDADAINAFERELKRIYKAQGRGRSCHVDAYQRRDPLRFCYFAYPEDFPTGDVEYDEDHNFRRVTRRPALENVFIYDPETGVLEVSATGPKDHKEALAEAFCIHILGLKALPPDSGRPEYTLKPMLSQSFSFPVEPEDGVESMEVRSIRLDHADPAQTRITVNVKPDGLRNAIHDSIRRTQNLGNSPLDVLHPSWAEVTVQFKSLNGKRGKRLTFPITYPDRCGLKDDPYDQVAKRILRRAGIAND